ARTQFIHRHGALPHNGPCEARSVSPSPRNFCTVGQHKPRGCTLTWNRRGSGHRIRLNRGQELVIGGHVPGPHGLDSIIVGYYEGAELRFVAKVRNGFVPAWRRKLFGKLESLVTPKCPFVNLPESRLSRWGEGLTAEGMKNCVWL